MVERTDQEWTRLLKQNDLQAVHDLWELLHSFAIAATRHYRQDEDVGNDAAVAAYTRIRQKGVYQYGFACPFPGYCRQIVVNELLRLMKQSPPPADDIDEETDQFVGEEDSPSQADRDTVQSRLQECLEQLGNRAREVINLLYYEGLTPEKAAEHLGILRNNLNVIAYRAREGLRDCLRAKGFETAAEALSL
jgi:RNA polymerase sigma factor (sigma-70 family)